MQPLEGIKVLDFSRVLAGPFCTMNLGDLGADVVKVESVDTGDETRGWGPPFAGGESAYYLCVNRNKRSIAVNLKSEEGQKLVQNLIREADVVIHKFLQKSAERLGVAYHQVKQINGNVIYCSISGYGALDPRPGYDYIMQAVGGLMSITGEPKGQPMKVGVAITDLFTGLYAVTAIQAALLYRLRTGTGQLIDMALYDAQIAMLANVASNVLISGNDAPRLGNGHPNIVPYQLFNTKDGQVILTIGNNHQFQSLCREFELEQLAEDSRFQSNEKRVLHREELIPVLSEQLQKFTTEEVLASAARAKIPSGPVHSVKEALNSPDTKRRDMLWNVEHPLLGNLSLVASPLKLSEAPVAYLRVPPRHGEQTTEIAQELGYSEHQIQQLIKQGVLKSC